MVRHSSSAPRRQLGKLTASNFKGGIIVFDEYASLATAHGNDKGGTISDPAGLAKIMREVVSCAKHVIVMDRDLTLTPIPSKHLALIAPSRDVVHVRFEAAGESLLLHVLSQASREERSRQAPCTRPSAPSHRRVWTLH